MMRQKKRRKRCLMMALCLMTLLTGCEETDKALVFTSESLAQEADAAQQGEIPMYEPGVMWQQTASGIGEADDRETGVTGTAGLIYVHVCGAVLAPGVVEVPAGSRAEDVLDAAGGFAPDADREYVNLASLVEDGQQLYFPTIEEAERWRESMSVSRSGQIVEQSMGGLININTADEALLCTLPGIGEARARAIVSYRTQRGPFEKPEDIMKVSGIKQSAFDKISTQIVVE